MSDQPTGEGHAHHSKSDWMTSHLKGKRPHIIERDIKLLEGSQLVTKLLSSGKFKGNLESVLKGLIDGTGNNRALLNRLQLGVVSAAQIEQAHQQRAHWSLSGVQGVGSSVKPVNDLKGEKYNFQERIARCKLASLYRLIDRLGWSQLIFNHISVNSIP